MDKNVLKVKRRWRRKHQVRKNVFGSPERPRLTVFRSNLNIYAQIVNDVEGKTLAAASSVKLDKGSTAQAAAEVGKQLAEAAKAAGVEAIAFDRNGYMYHGRIKALADAAREAGLKF